MRIKCVSERERVRGSEREREREHNAIPITSARKTEQISPGNLFQNNTNLVLFVQMNVVVFRLVKKKTIEQTELEDKEAMPTSLIICYSCSLSSLCKKTRADVAVLRGANCVSNSMRCQCMSNSQRLLLCVEK